MAGSRAGVHRSGCASRAARRGSDHVLLRLRPDCSEPPSRSSRAAADHAPSSVGRPPSPRPRRWLDRAHRRPSSHRGAHAQHARDRRGVGREASGTGRALPELRGCECRAHGEQSRLDGPAVSHRLPARDRQALPRRHDDQEGCGERASELRRRHQLHRVQLPDPAGAGLPRALPPVRLPAADRGQ